MTTFDTNCVHTARTPRTSRLPFMQMMDAYRSRRALAALPAYRLEDLGLTRDQAQKEANRPIWDVPSNWRG